MIEVRYAEFGPTVRIRVSEMNGMRSYKLCLILLILLNPLLGMAEEIYRSVNERGQVSFTDTPPAGRPVEVIELMPGPSDRAVQEAETRNQALRDHLESMRQEREQKEQMRSSKIDEAKKALQAAEEELAVAREVEHTDWQMTASGNRHLKAEYFERVKQAELAVETARKNLQEAKSGG
jgi:hypothetical protein